MGPIGNDYHNLITTDGNYEVQLAMLSTKARVKLFKPYRNHGIISFWNTGTGYGIVVNKTWTLLAVKPKFFTSAWWATESSVFTNQSTARKSYENSRTFADVAFHWLLMQLLLISVGSWAQGKTCATLCEKSFILEVGDVGLDLFWWVGSHSGSILYHYRGTMSSPETLITALAPARSPSGI